MEPSLLVGCQGFGGFPDGSLPPPNAVTHAKACHIWQSNNYSLKCCLLAHISMHDYDSVNKFPTAHGVFDALHKTHERRGVHAQAMLIREALDIRCNTELELWKPIDDIRMLHKRIAAIGPVDHDQLLTVFLLNSLGEKLQPLHSQLLNAIDDPSFSSEMIIRRFGYEESYHRHRLTQNPSLSTALVAPGRNKSCPSCTHCKKLGHFTEFCIQSGGKMAGRSIEEACAA